MINQFPVCAAWPTCLLDLNLNSSGNGGPEVARPSPVILAPGYQDDDSCLQIRALWQALRLPGLPNPHQRLNYVQHALFVLDTLKKGEGTTWSTLTLFPNEVPAYLLAIFPYLCQC